ncbi:hypothetical protein O3M35_001995 [Rhynocoris fuscipes]|uniref:Uncharacterized protein n=1 Tax=Rhynocoris fuscipes TaxID=488301 RepID=A0AAW1CTH7_9HEMI
MGTSCLGPHLLYVHHAKYPSHSFISLPDVPSTTGSLSLYSLPPDISLLLSDSSPHIPNIFLFLQDQNLY